MLPFSCDRGAWEYDVSVGSDIRAEDRGCRSVVCDRV